MVALAIITCIMLSSLTILAFLYYMEYFSRKRRLIHKIPGPPCLPFIGNVHLVTPGKAFYHQVLYFSNMFKHHQLFKVILGHATFVIFRKAEVVEQILSSSRYLTKADEYRFLYPWLGTGLLTSTGKKWQTHRRLLTPTFHFKILGDFLQVFNEQCDVMIEKLRHHHAGKGTFNVFNNITLCALDIICETAMGIDIEAQSQSQSEYVKAIYRISHLIHNRQLNPLLWPDVLYNTFSKGKESQHCIQILHELSRKVIRERKHEMSQQIDDTSGDEVCINEAATIGKRKRLAFLDMLLYAQRQNPELTDEDIREEVDTFMFEGHDTTAAAINWAIHLIGAHPDVQEKLHEEMDNIFGDSRRHVQTEDLPQMKYLTCVIKEALRLFPSVPFFGRKIEKDCVISGYTIPRGATAIIFTIALHLNEDVFPDPHRFDPDRFLPEKCSNRHPYAYAPFSAGPRNCIGQKFAMNEEKVMLSSILRNFHIESMQTREQLAPMTEIILRPQDGIFIKLTER